MDYATCLADGRIRDSRAPDGMPCSGWRLVRSGGWVKAFGAWWQHDKLIPYDGGRVFVVANDYWYQDAIVYREYSKDWICDLHYSKDKRS